MTNSRFEIYRKAIASRRYDADKVAVLYVVHDLDAGDIATVCDWDLEKANRLTHQAYLNSIGA